MWFDGTPPGRSCRQRAYRQPNGRGSDSQRPYHRRGRNRGPFAQNRRGPEVRWNAPIHAGPAVLVGVPTRSPRVCRWAWKGTLGPRRGLRERLTSSGVRLGSAAQSRPQSAPRWERVSAAPDQTCRTLGCRPVSHHLGQRDRDTSCPNGVPQSVGCSRADGTLCTMAGRLSASNCRPGSPLGDRCNASDVWSSRCRP